MRTRQTATARRSPKVPHRNRNHAGWWIASFIERFEYYDENKANLNRRCLAYENTILIRAPNREVAYRKAVAQGRLSNGSEGWSSSSGRKGAWRFDGLTGLLPVYEELEDGAEILWQKHADVTVRRIRSRIKRKQELSVFNDREPKGRALLESSSITSSGASRRSTLGLAPRVPDGRRRRS